MKKISITISYSVKENQLSYNMLSQNLNDAAVSLDKNLRKHHNASSKATLVPGKAVFQIEGADKTTLEPYMNAFLDRMKKEGSRIFISYNEHP